MCQRCLKSIPSLHLCCHHSSPSHHPFSLAPGTCPLTVLTGKQRVPFKMWDHAIYCWVLSMAPRGLRERNLKPPMVFHFQKTLWHPSAMGPPCPPLFLPYSHAGLLLLLCFSSGNSASSVPLTDLVLPWASGMGSSFFSIRCHLNVTPSEKASLTTLSNILLPPSSLLLRHFAYSENLA